MQKPERITDRLKAKLEFWKYKWPSTADLEDQFFSTQSRASPSGAGAGDDGRPPVDTAKLWSHYSYECIMYGMEHIPNIEAHMTNGARPPAQIQQRVKMRVKNAPSKLPKHEEYLREKIGLEDYPTGPRPAGWS